MTPAQIPGALVPGTAFRQEDLYLAPTGALGQTLPRTQALITNAAILTSGTLRMSGLFLPAGTLITSISFMAATGLTNPTNWWFGLYNSSLVGLRLTADQTTTAWANNTSKTVALTSTYTTTYTGLYYVGIMVAAGAAGQFFGVQPGSAGPTSAVAPILTFSSTTGLTTPPADGQPGGVGGTATNTGAAGSYCYAWVS